MTHMSDEASEVSFTQQPDTNEQQELLCDVLHDALGVVVAQQRREFTQARELYVAQTQAITAQMRAIVVEANAALAEVRNACCARLAELKDGEKGEKGDVG